MREALIWLPEDTTVREGAARNAQRANAASKDITKDQGRLDRATTQQLLTRLETLKKSLQQRLLPGITDFKRYDLQARLADVDRLIGETAGALAADAERQYGKAQDLAVNGIDEPIKAAGVTISPALPGLDSGLVQASFGNTVDLLTPAMQQFASQVKVNLRQVALAGDNRMDAIQRLERSIAGQGFDSAQYKAERIIRTELSRTFNGATYARMVTLSKEFPFLRKGWRATNDRRTRQGHVEAGKKYGRGAGIPIPNLFVINVYDERPKKAPVLIGQASLKFPVDPEVQPAGRIGAAATIMCRCNGFIDFNLDEYAAFVKQQTQVIVPGVPAGGPVVPPTSAPKPRTPAAAKARPAKATLDPDKALAKELKGSTNFYQGAFYGGKAQMEDVARRLQRPGLTVAPGGRGGKFYVVRDVQGNVYGPRGWTTPKLKVPKVAIPTPAQVTPTKAAPKGPAGPSTLSKALTVAPGFDKVAQAVGLIDRVHGTSVLPPIPAGAMPSRYRAKAAAGYISSSSTGRPLALGFSKKILGNAPNMATFHEVGHYLDHQGIAGPGVFASLNTTGDTPIGRAMDKWRAAVKNSAAIQRLQQFHVANLPEGGGSTYGDGNIPLGVNRPLVNYLLTTKETFARSYAQYVATKSRDPKALKELRNMQAASQMGMGPVARSTPYGPAAVQAKAPKPGTWDYPWQWQDDDFKAIESAFDDLMDVLGWRKSQ